MEWTSGVTLSSDGNHAYVTGLSAVSWYERNASTGALSLRRNVEGWCRRGGRLGRSLWS